MKKFITLLLIFTLLLSLGSLCFADEPIVIIPSEGSGSETVIDPATEEPSSAPEPTEEPVPTQEPSPSPTETPAPTAAPKTTPVITKDPTGENVYIGDRAVFIARADNAKTITWYLVSPDGATTILASSVPQLFKGINVSGTDGEKLVLENVNTKLSGYKAYARFGNDEGFTDSAAAVVTVSAATAPSATPAVTPSPKPTTKPVPTSTPVPAATPAVTATPVPVATPSVTPRPSSNTDNSSSSSGFRIGFGTIFLLILSLAVIAGAAIVLSMYVRGTIDLSWLESIFMRKASKKENGRNSATEKDEENVDVPDSFYDPDDYKK